VKPLPSLAPFAALLAAACVATVAPPAQGKPGDTFGSISVQHLDNGMTVIVEEDHRAPLVSLTLRYDLGAGSMPPGREGVARVTTALMLDRSEHAPPGEAARLLERAGATRSRDDSGPTSALFWVTMPAGEIALPLWAWSDQMGFFDHAIDEPAVAAQRARIIAARREAIEGRRLGRVDLIAAEEVYPDDNPNHFAFAAPAYFEHVDRASVVAFHDAWITPDHATLGIVGDVDARAAFALVARYFGSIPRSAEARPPRWEPAPRLAGETRVDVAADVPAATVSVRWLTARVLTADDACLDVVAHLFKSTRTSWLSTRLVDAKKVATDVLVRERVAGTGAQFEITVDGAPGRSPDELVAAIDAALDEIRALEPTVAEIRGAAYEALINRLVGFELTSARAAEYARFSATVGEPGYLRHDVERYEAVTPASVRAAIAAWLPRDRRVVIAVTPTKGASVGGDRIQKRFVAARTP
jgi:zinc protease